MAGPSPARSCAGRFSTVSLHAVRVVSAHAEPGKGSRHLLTMRVVHDRGLDFTDGLVEAT